MKLYIWRDDYTSFRLGCLLFILPPWFLWPIFAVFILNRIYQMGVLVLFLVLEEKLSIFHCCNVHCMFYLWLWMCWSSFLLLLVSLNDEISLLNVYWYSLKKYAFSPFMLLVWCITLFSNTTFRVELRFLIVSCLLSIVFDLAC